MIALTFLEHISGDRYEDIKLLSKRSIILPDTEVILLPGDLLLLIHYDGDDFYSTYAIGEYSEYRLESVDDFLSKGGNTRSCTGSELATDSRFAERRKPRNEIRNINQMVQFAMRPGGTKKTTSSSGKLRKRTSKSRDDTR